jgi:hypothetical protein
MALDKARPGEGSQRSISSGTMSRKNTTEKDDKAFFF